MRHKPLFGNVGYYYEAHALNNNWYCCTTASHDTYKHWTFRAAI